MKNKIYIACFIFTCIQLATTEPVFSKEKEKRENSNNLSSAVSTINSNTINPIWGFYIDAFAGLASINTSGLTSDIWKTEGNFAYTSSIGYFYSVHPMIKMKGGIGVSSYKASLTGNGEIESPQLVDIDNDTYIEKLTIQNAEQTINPMYLTIPLICEFGTANISQVGYYVDIGLEYSYLINEKNSTAGSYTTKGYYPQWGVTLENVPELGYYSDQNIGSDLKLKKSILSVRGAGGITIPISGTIIFKLGIAGYMGLNSVGKSTTNVDNNESISKQTSEFRSSYIYNPLSTTKGNKARRIGVEYGLYICKRVK
ncbi:outer membrane beta-barrel protein [Prolixibacteraceae bacterium Z1-6]|uniref:Outer membrane beta-barrel protein n=1 Tax=Draconibacterium aestuarii TaxID=2998507 RepID=A0A9X3J4L4_9BACT|nr:outer membrane beta-barrel protein [Prolixibacteraceae bacterium Z1-6]